MKVLIAILALATATTCFAEDARVTDKEEKGYLEEDLAELKKAIPHAAPKSDGH